MRDLQKEVEKKIEEFFNEKIKRVDVPDEKFDEIWDLISDMEEDIEYALEDVDRKIDYILEEFEKDRNPSLYEEMMADQRARQDALARENDLYSIDNGYYLTR